MPRSHASPALPLDYEWKLACAARVRWSCFQHIVFLIRVLISGQLVVHRFSVTRMPVHGAVIFTHELKHPFKRGSIVHIVLHNSIAGLLSRVRGYDKRVHHEGCWHTLNGPSHSLASTFDLPSQRIHQVEVLWIKEECTEAVTERPHAAEVY